MNLVETARRARGSAILPTVSFGTMNAEVLLLKMADRIEQLEQDKEKQRVDIKPLDLSNLLKHAFLSGFVEAKNLPAHEPYNGMGHWVEYDPTGNAAYTRILALIEQSKDYA